MPANGTIPIVSAPPADVSPATAQPFGISLGMVEILTSPDTPIPDEFFEEGLVTRTASFAFNEYAIDVVNGVPVQVSLTNQTIDWSASQLNSQGTIILNLGIVQIYQLAGKIYTARQYTFLGFSCVYDEGGESKSCSFITRLKHF